MFAVIFNVALIFTAVSLALPLSVCGAALPDASGKIVFISNRDGKDQIYAMNADGSTETRLTIDKRSFTSLGKTSLPLTTRMCR